MESINSLQLWSPEKWKQISTAQPGAWGCVFDKRSSVDCTVISLLSENNVFLIPDATVSEGKDEKFP